jgi:hypothetical protein
MYSKYWLAGLALVSFSWCHAASFEGMSYLDNGEIKVGANLDIGGAITHVSKSGDEENVINSHDWGRQIQMSFYSGPTPFVPNGKEPDKVWRFLGWNPIQSGDCFGNKSKVIAHSNDGTSLYVKCIPMQWPLNNEPGECTFETWITLEGKTAKVRSKINNARSDTTQFPGRGQELPAIYTNGSYYRLFTYTGGAPFSGESLYRVAKVWDTSQGPQEVEGGPWEHWYATENWAALVNESDWGIGVWSPGTCSFVGGFAGKPGKGGPKDGPTGYIAPLGTEILDHNIEYAYDYVLILGSLEEIRGHVYENASRESLPSYRFEKDRESWLLRNCTDQGWPLNGAWNVSLTGKQAALVGPKTFWDAAALPRVFLRAAFNTGSDKATLRWQRFGKKGAEKFGEITFAVQSDGKMRTHEIDLSASPAYQGPCTQFILRPAVDDAAGRNIVLESLAPQAP